MNTIDSILQTLAEYLASAPALREAAFVTEYPAGYKSYPLKKPTVSVGIKSLAMDAGSFGGYLGRDAATGNDIMGQQVKMEVLLSCYFPSETSGLDCYKLVTLLSQTLVDGCPVGGLSELTVEPIRYDSNTSACRADVTLRLKTVVGTQKDERLVEDFILIHRPSGGA